MKHKKPDFMLKYFSVFKVLLRLANFDAIREIEKTIFNKITNKVKKEQSAKTIKAYTMLL